MSHFKMTPSQTLQSNMGARKDRACEGAMHSPWSEVGTFLVVWQGHLTQCMHCTPLYDRWTTQISPRDPELNGAWKKKEFYIYLYGHKEKLFIFLTTTTSTAAEIEQTGFFFKNIFRWIDLCVLQDASTELFCVFGDFYASGTHDAEVTKSLTFVLTFCVHQCVCVHWDGEEVQKMN